MGLPVNSLEAGLPRETLSSYGQDMFDAPFRLQTESYEEFARLLPGLEQDTQSRQSVHDELRRLDIDPKLFYRNQQRLRVSELPPELLDPTSAASFESMRSLIGELEKPTEAHDIFSPPARVETEITSSSKQKPAGDRGRCPLNVPNDQVPPITCEEISLAKEGETHGGRLGHETPEGLSSRLQIDRLTDDGEETDFRQDLAGCDDEDLVEAFALDPDFDYDNTELSSKVAESRLGEMFRSPPRSGEGARETETQEPQEPEDDEILEDAVEEP